ncbi:autotransporter outer membrane beta-barrel domain-containing protein [Polynucleobacter sp. 80A-SIGWE]|uniref:beta strand repeat-containing protein n=1 Tax=Polynucleobacter sp. 80A-SIGWE TaxID=2689100 RepID=UPI001C0B87D2|nr:autotransporter outer membrane beta-barrel domain-containing protein [Polynucleobacter sp. 80A-SIGWE]MBU3588680.1 autotransporter domain-containing protein [Polynucleobacter sp. 80A-SIGWE]
MKIKNQLLALVQISLIGGLSGFSSLSHATACTANASPTADCSDLTVNTSTGSITNNYSLTATGSGSFNTTGSGVLLGTFTNNATINPGSSFGVAVQSGATISNFNNTGNIYGLTGNSIYISPSGAITNLNNSGTIQSTTTNAIQNASIPGGASGTIGTFINSGSVVSNTGAYGFLNSGSVGTITNLALGAVTGSAHTGFGASGSGIDNTGTIGTLNSAQNDLFYRAKLPSNYNVIIFGGAVNYGQTYFVLPANPTSGPMNFGVYAGSAITTNSYANVLENLPTGNIGATRTGTYQGLTWTLGAVAGTDNWDLTFSGTNTSAMAALNQTTAALQNAFTLQNTVLVNGFTYDCPVFDKNNVCVSVGGRYTTANTDSVNSTGGLLIGAYRMNNQIRMGAYIDQNVSTNSTGIVKVANASPMVGVFGVWIERLDGTGAEVKVSAGYGQKNTTMTRPVVDGTEAGSGSSTLTSQGAQAIGKYGFAVADKTTVSPYVGLRYSQNNMGGYTEGSSAAVTAPLTYGAVNTNATTVVAGLGANYKLMPDVVLLASAGLENDLNTSNGNYTATGLYGLNSINFNASPVRTRATATLGAYYDLAKNQRLGINGIYRQEPYQGVTTTSVMATYMVGL